MAKGGQDAALAKLQEYEQTRDFKSRDALAQRMNDAGMTVPELTPADEFMPEELGGYQFHPRNVAGNFMSSAGDALSGVYDAVTNSLESAAAIGDTIIGGSQKYDDYLNEQGMSQYGLHRIPSLPGMLTGDRRGTAEGVADHYADRYGGVQNVLDTVQEDPAGMLLDFLPGTSAGGNLAKVPSAAVRAPLHKKSPIGPEKVMESALKPPSAMSRPERDQLVETVLNERVAPTPGGLERLQGKKKEIGGQVDALIEQASSTGGTVNIQTLLSSLAPLMRERGGNVIGGGKDAGKIREFIDEIIADANSLGKTDLRAADLQDIKRKLYGDIAWDARRQVDTPPVLEESRKVVARGAKEAIEDLAPGAKEANERFGRLLEAEPHIERATGRIENRDMFGMTDAFSLSALGGGTALGMPGLGALAAGTIEALSNPKISRRTAQVTHAIREGRVGKGVQRWLVDNPTASQAAIAAYIEGEANPGDGKMYYRNESEQGRLSGAQ